MIFQLLGADEWNGVDYAQNSSVQLSHSQRLLHGLTLNGNERILDVGCGDGRFTLLLAEKVPDGFVVGIDPSESMLDRAAISFQNSGISNLIFQKSTAEDFTSDDCFDHIIAIHVMHWIKEQEKALKNMHRLLKPEGKVHIILAPSKEGFPFHAALQKTLKNWKQDFCDFVNPQQVFDIETYRQLMVKTGFHIEGLYYLYHESIHENKERLKSWIKQWNPHVKHLTHQKQFPFLDELINNYILEIGSSPHLEIPVKWGEYILIVEAKKIQNSSF